MPLNILVTGSPGVGKTLFSSLLKERLDAVSIQLGILNVSQLVKDEGLYEEYDQQMDTFVMADSKVKKRVKVLLAAEPGTIIETHTIEVVPRKLVDHVFVLRAPSTALYYDRLAARSYPKAKIEENLDCEIMQVIWMDAVERFGEENVSAFISETQDQIQEALDDAVAAIRSLLE